jgi:FAD/FMN-containing dehydrogenase
MEVIGPGEGGYDRLRAVFDHRVDRRPAAIARCRTADDVAAAVSYAAERGLAYTGRSGAMSGESTLDDGLVVELSGLDDVAVDAGRGVARVGGGVTWARLDAAARGHGLAVTGGRVSWTGVAGVALGEGSGWLERALGPTGDHVAGMEAVLPDGERVERPGTALPHGAIATALTLRLSPVDPVMLCGFLTYPGRRAREVAAAYRDLMAGALPAVGGALTLYAGRAGGCQVAFCFRGPIDDGARWLRPLRALGPTLDAVAPNPYVAFQAMTDTQHPFGMRAERRVRPVGALTDDLLEAVLQAAGRPAGSALSRIVLRPGGGVLDGPAWSCECLGLWPPVASLDAPNLAWVEHADAALSSPALSA